MTPAETAAKVIAARRAQQAERAELRRQAKARVTATNPQFFSARYAR